MNNREKLGIITVLIIMIIILVVGFFMLRTDGVQCINNPLQYGIDELANNNNAAIQCTCWTNITNVDAFVIESSNIPTL